MAGLYNGNKSPGTRAFSLRGLSPVPIYVAIALTLIASTCMNLGLVLQKKGVVELTRTPQPQRRGRVRKYLSSPTWRWGMALLVVGYSLFMTATFSRAAPISLLQPIFA